jgi:hypothetical protein
MKTRLRRSEYRARESALAIVLSAACLWESRGRINKSRKHLLARKVPRRS